MAKNEVWWIKLATEMFDDEKIRLIEAMPDADTLLIIWVKLLCQAGKVNADGYIFLSRDIPFTDNDLATLFKRPINTIRLALATFQQFNMLTIDESGIIFLPNWWKYQNIEGMEKVREQARIRKAKSRENQKLLANLPVTLPVTLPSRDKRDQSKSKELDIKKEIIKDVYGEFQNVFLSKEEFQKLTDKLNGSLPALIEELSSGIASKGYKYKSHYATLLNWAGRREKEKERENNGTIRNTQNKGYSIEDLQRGSGVGEYGDRVV